MSISSGSLLATLKTRLPLLMIGIILVGCLMYGVAVIMPQWRIHENLVSDNQAGQEAIAATMTAQSGPDSSIILQHQISKAQDDLEKSSSSLLTQAQVDDLQRKLYDYSAASGAKIASLLAQQTDPQGPQNATVGVFDTRSFHAQVSGTVIQLMNFVILFREASTPGVTIRGININKNGAQYTLAMDISMRVSSLASGLAFADLSDRPTPAVIALAATFTPTPTPTLPPTATPIPPTATPSTPTLMPTDTATEALSASPTLAGQCALQSTPPGTQKMHDLAFSQIQHATGSCDIQTWPFKLAGQGKFVMDIVRRSGSGQYRMELHDSSDKVVASTLSSVDGRGILVTDSVPGTYTLEVIPLAAPGNWVYDIAIWPGLPTLSFAWAQNSYSNHTSAGAQSNVMTWTYTLTGDTQTYHIQSTRTDGNLEYAIVVTDASKKQVATGKSSSGNVVLDVTTGTGTYFVQMTTVDGTSGSYRIALVH